MQRGNKMSSELARKVRLSAAVMAVAMGGSAMAAVINYDTQTTAGYQTDTGTWDFNNTADWSTSGTTLVPWTSNGDTAIFNLSSTYSGKTLTVDNSYGQVGAASLSFTGSLGGGTWTLAGGTVQLGSSGIQYTQTNGAVTISAPLQLTASQTWTSNKSAQDVLKVNGGISGTGNLTFDGRGAGTAPAAGDSVTFNLGGTSSFSGSTTVTGSAILKLDYSVSNTQKLDSASTLYLNNGKILINGVAGGYNDAVASTSLGTGQNTINHSGAGTIGTDNVLNLGLVTRVSGATLDIGTSSASLVTMSNTSTDGSTAGGPTHILGGWATCFGETGWLVRTSTGLTGSTNGTSLNSTSGWASTTNVKLNPAAAGSGTFAITTNTSANVLQLNTSSGSGNDVVTISDGVTLTLVSGGLMDSTASNGTTGGSAINGGRITSGMSTGELFADAGRVGTQAFTLGSQIIDNGSTHVALVKGGSNTLILTAANTNTGRTYINGGKLLLDNGGSLANANMTITNGKLAGGTNGTGGTLNFNINGSTGDEINIASLAPGLDLTNLKANFTFNGPTQSEYVLADKAVGSGYVTGTQFASTNLDPTAWSINYAGTAAHPGDIVLVAVPEPTTLSLLAGAALLGLSVRRSRRPERMA